MAPRNIAAAVCAIWVCGAVPAAADAVVYIPKAADWKYAKGLGEASSPGDAWRADAFDDEAWLSGRAPFGYGEPIDFGTELSDMRHNYTTLFLRRAFTVASPDAVNDLAADVHYDDGFILWINGREVLRVNAPAVPAYDAVAPVAIEPTPASMGLGEPRDYLRAGENVLAVQVFNQSLASSDLVFDLRLYDPIGSDTTPPAVASIVPVEGAVVRSLVRIEVTFTELVAGVDASDLRINGEPAAAVAGTGAGPYAFTFGQPPDGEVQVAWAPGHGITDAAETPNAFGGGSWTYTLDPTIALGDLVINEFLASNRTILRDEDGQYSDWIELWNRGARPINLGGFALTDAASDPGRWPLPAVTLGADDYLVIFASGKDRRGAGGELHANFKLGAEGEYLGLYRLDAEPAVVHEYAPAFPEQRGDYSYGLDSAGAPRYFQTPTPGAANNTGAAFNGFTETPVPSMPHGVYAEPFWLTLTSGTPGAQIYWRAAPDGREPTPANATPYTGPILIAGTAARGAVTLRAAAYKDGLLPSRVLTASYIFPEHVLGQPAAPPGFPATWGNASKIPGDYELDPAVVNNPAYAQLALDALTTAPSLSIVMNVDDLFAPATGIYSNGAREGIAWERAASAELLYPDGSKGFQIDCGIRIQGGTSTTPWKSPKLSLRLLFKGDYGPAKLRFPLFPDSPLREFNTLVLDAHLNHVWHHPDAGQQQTAQYVRDTFASDLQNAMGSLAPHDVFLNLYINGLHWGMYDVHERPDEHFQAAYLGGEPEDYDVLKHNRATVVNGAAAAFADLLDNRLADLAAPANYERLLERLDAVDFADYMIMNLYIGNNDWSHQNWYVGRDRVSPGALFRFFSWDAEHAVDLDATWDEFSASAQDSGCPWVIFNALRKNAEFKLLFADRAHRHFLNGGVLYVDPSASRWNPAEPERTRPTARYMRRIAEIDALIVIESARWGDCRRTPAYTRADWLAELNKLLASWFPRRSQIVLGHFVREGLYPAVGAPVFSRHGGRITPGFALAMTRPAGTSGAIYYTTDGSDPRRYGTGAPAAPAQVYTAPVAIFEDATVKARTRDGTVWSALTEARFTIPAPFDAPQVTEVMYH
ncbi:MAG TPA: CotH kinase family protein, partial [Planctomycetota bacterium]|nr:CotH kinase family protein [Planctomycetota bacterium]